MTNDDKNLFDCGCNEYKPVPPVEPMEPWDSFINQTYDSKREGVPFYDNRADYNTNSKSYYDDLARKTRLISVLASRIWEYDKQMVKRLQEWDARLEHFPEDVKQLLIKWLEDGTLKDIINHEIFNDLNDLINTKQHSNSIYHRKPFLKLPMRFPDYDWYIKQHDLKNVYPSAFDIDWVDRKLFMVSLGATKPSGVYADRIITVYDIDKCKYISSFYAGYLGGEGITVKYENGIRYLYLQHGTQLARYNISELPQNKTKIEPVSYHAEGVHWTFANDGNSWLITQNTPEIGYKDQRTTHAYYSNSFTRLGFIQTKQADWGYFNADEYDNNTKVQTMTIGNGKIYLGIGAYLRDDRVDYKGKIGLKVLSNSGEILENGLMNSQKVIDKFKSIGLDAEIMENEGVHVDKRNGNVYTLNVYQTDQHDDSINGGVVIMQEYATHQDAIDFSDCAETIRTGTIEGHQPITITNSDNTYAMENHMTGEKLDTIQKILDYMFSIKRNKFSFYSTQVKVKWFDGKEITGARYIDITNVNNTYFWIEVPPYITRARESYFVTRNHSEGTYTVQRNRLEGTQTTYLYDTDWNTLKDLTFGFYETPMPKTKLPPTPTSYPDTTPLVHVKITGSATRTKYEIFIPATHQTFIATKIEGVMSDVTEAEGKK